MVNHTKVLYPLSYPVDDSSDYWYVESPLSNDYRSEASRLMKEYYIFTDIELPIAPDLIIRTNLRVYKKLDKNNDTVTKYTIQYEDKSNNAIVRADNDHSYPHIDLILPHKSREKKIFDTDPSDYEASINTVLRCAEFYDSHTVGIDYWLLNLVTFKRELIHSYFNTTRGYFKSSTAYTDVARLVAVEMITAKEDVNYDDGKLAGVITNKFLKCKIYEEQYNRPLKISKNLIQTDVHANLLPFPLVLANSIPFVSTIFDNDGLEVPATGKFFPLGKTTFLGYK